MFAILAMKTGMQDNRKICYLFGFFNADSMLWDVVTMVGIGKEGVYGITKSLAATVIERLYLQVISNVCKVIKLLCCCCCITE